MPAYQGADHIAAHVAEFGHQYKEKHIMDAGDPGEKINFLYKVKQPGNINEPEKRCGDTDQRRRMMLREELTRTEAQDEQNNDSGFKIIGAGIARRPTVPDAGSRKSLLTEPDGEILSVLKKKATSVKRGRYNLRRCVPEESPVPV